MFSEILFILTATPLVIAIWVGLFLIFDDVMLNGYFKEKMRKRFNKDEL